MDADLTLIEQWRSGDPGAGQELFTRHFADVYRFLDNKVRGEGSELVQRTFLACERARDRFHQQSSFRTYLLALARHELYRYLQQLRDERIDFEVSSIADMVTAPATRVERTRELELLRAALAELPLEQQLVLELHYWHDLDAAALAEVFEVTATAARTKLSRARRALRDRLAGRLGHGDPHGGPADRMVAAVTASDGIDEDLA